MLVVLGRPLKKGTLLNLLSGSLRLKGNLLRGSISPRLALSSGSTGCASVQVLHLCSVPGLTDCPVVESPKP